MKSVVIVLISGLICQVFASFPFLLAPRSAGVSKKCRIQSEIYAQSLANLTQWAVKMYDASAKLPHGVIVGNNYQFGNFDECIRAHVDLGPVQGGTLDGQYCLLHFQLGTDDPWHPPRFDLETDPFESVWNKLKPSGEISIWKRNYLYYGACVPASCTPNDVLLTVKEMMRNYPISENITVSLEPAQCQTRKSITQYKEFSSFDILILSLLFGLAALVLYSTAYDFWHYRKQEQKIGGATERVLLCFSARQNLPDCIMPRKTVPEFDFLSGTRTLFTILVVYGHRWRMNVQAPLHDVTPYEEKAREFSVLITCLIVVNSFLSISGFLTGYLFYPELEKWDERKKLSLKIIVAPVIYRLLRFTPLYAVVILLNLSILPKLGEGPLWPSMVGKEVSRCSKTWWTNMLYINNYVQANDMCIYQSWYLSTDLQLFLLAMILLYITKKSEKVGLTLFGLLISGSILWHGILLYLRSDFAYLTVDEQSMRAIPDVYYYVTYYIPAHFRLAPYMISTLLGLLLHKWKDTPSNISTLQANILGAGLVVFMAIVKESGNLFALLEYSLRFHRFATAIYGCLHAALWSLGFSLLIMLNFRKRIGWAILIFNSYPFLMINKLSFGTYLIHSIVHTYEYASLRVPKVPSRFHEYWLTAGDIVFTNALALVLCVLVEMPSSKLVKLLFSNARPKPEIKDPQKISRLDSNENLREDVKNNDIIKHAASNGNAKNGFMNGHANKEMAMSGKTDGFTPDERHELTHRISYNRVADLIHGYEKKEL
nr:PREDICTED: nose resistant to fluoxetine protein 6-like isoform X1 [Bemisia tabaci]